MEDGDYVPREAKNFYSTFGRSQALSPEIVVVEGDKLDGRGRGSSDSPGKDTVVNDVYVAVGKDDTDVVKWTIDNAVSPGTRVFLVHVFPPITHIPTPVGRLARNKLNEDQVSLYLSSEGNKRKNLLQNYVNLCNDAKVTVETMLLERSDTAKGVLDLIPVLSITHLVIGTKRSPHSRRVRKKLSVGEFVWNNAPTFCEVTIVHEGKKVEANQQAKSTTRPDFQKSFFACFLDSVQEDEDFLSCISKNGYRDE